MAADKCRPAIGDAGLDDICNPNYYPNNKATFNLKPGQNFTVHRFCQFEKDTKGVFLMHNVGSGKTLTSLTIALNSFDNWEDESPAAAKMRNILVIHPTGLYPNFHNELTDNIPGVRCVQQTQDAINPRKITNTYMKQYRNETLDGTTPRHKCVDRSFTVESRDYSTIKDEFFQRGEAPVEKTLNAFRKFFEDKIVIFDEVHRLFRRIDPKNNSSPRIIDVYIKNKILAPYTDNTNPDNTSAGAKRVIFMSGTPLNENIKDIARMLCLVNSSIPDNRLINYDNFKNREIPDVLLPPRNIDNFDLIKEDVDNYFLYKNYLTTQINIIKHVGLQFGRIYHYALGMTGLHPRTYITTIKTLQNTAVEQYKTKFESWYGFFNVARFMIGIGSHHYDENVFIKNQKNIIQKRLEDILGQQLQGGGAMNKQMAYKILGLKQDQTYTDVDIKKIYRQLALERHPNKGGTEEQFQELTEAYEFLITAPLQTNDSTDPDSFWYSPEITNEIFKDIINYDTMLEMVNMIVSSEEYDKFKKSIPSDYFINEMYSMPPEEYITLIRQSLIMVQEINPIVLLKIFRTAPHDAIMEIINKENDESNEIINKVSSLSLEKPNNTKLITNIQKNVQYGGEVLVITTSLISVNAVYNNPTFQTYIHETLIPSFIKALPDISKYTIGFVEMITKQVFGRAIQKILENENTKNIVSQRGLEFFIASTVIPALVIYNKEIYNGIVGFFKAFFGSTGLIPTLRDRGIGGGIVNLFERFITSIRQTNFKIKLYKIYPYLTEFYKPSDMQLFEAAKQNGNERYAGILRANLERANAFDPLNIQRFCKRASKYISIIDTRMPQITSEFNEIDPANSIIPYGFKNTNLDVISYKYQNDGNFIIKDPATTNYPDKIVNIIYVNYTIDQMMFYNEIHSFNNGISDTMPPTLVPWYIKVGIQNNAIVGNYSKGVRIMDNNIDKTGNVEGVLVKFNKANNTYDLKLKQNVPNPNFSCPKFEKLLNYLILMKTGYMYNSDATTPDNKFIRQPHLVSVTNKQGTDLDMKTEIIPGIEKGFVSPLPSNKTPTHGWLPFVYSSSDEIGLNLFGRFLESRGYDYILLHEDTVNDNEQQDKAIKTIYPLLQQSDLKPDFKQHIVNTIIHSSNTSLENDLEQSGKDLITNLITSKPQKNPICVLLHKFRTEGIDAKHAPAIFLLDQPVNYGDYEQLCGRIMRTYNGTYEIAKTPKKMVYSFVCHTIQTIDKLIKDYTGIEKHPNAITYSEAASLDLFFNENSLKGQLRNTNSAGKNYKYLEPKEALFIADRGSIKEIYDKYKIIDLPTPASAVIKQLDDILKKIPQLSSNSQILSVNDKNSFLIKLNKAITELKIESDIKSIREDPSYKDINIDKYKFLITQFEKQIINMNLLNIIHKILKPLFFDNDNKPLEELDNEDIDKTILYLNNYIFGNEQIINCSNMSNDIDQIMNIKSVEYDFKRCVNLLIGEKGNPDLDAIIEYNKQLDEPNKKDHLPWCNEFFTFPYQSCMLNDKYTETYNRYKSVIQPFNANIKPVNSTVLMKSAIELLNKKYDQIALVTDFEKNIGIENGVPWDTRTEAFKIAVRNMIKNKNYHVTIKYTAANTAYDRNKTVENKNTLISTKKIVNRLERIKDIWELTYTTIESQVPLAAAAAGEEEEAAAAAAGEEEEEEAAAVVNGGVNVDSNRPVTTTAKNIRSRRRQNAAVARAAAQAQAEEVLNEVYKKALDSAEELANSPVPPEFIAEAAAAARRAAALLRLAAAAPLPPLSNKEKEENKEEEKEEKEENKEEENEENDETNFTTGVAYPPPRGGARRNRMTRTKNHKKRYSRQRRTRKVIHRPFKQQRKTRVYKPKSMKSLLRSRPKRTRKQFKN